MLLLRKQLPGHDSRRHSATGNARTISFQIEIGRAVMQSDFHSAQIGSLARRYLESPGFQGPSAKSEPDSHGIS